jgi:hypothetical protein
MSFDDGEVIDLHTNEGAYKHVSRFLREKAAPGGVFSSLGKLYPSYKNSVSIPAVDDDDERENTEGVVITCVYCGHEYPKGTPAAKHQLLTEHIKICESHPMRDAEATVIKLRSALSGVLGVDGKEDLEQMEVLIRLADAPAKDKAVTIDAIQALIDTL